MVEVLNNDLIWAARAPTPLVTGVSRPSLALPKQLLLSLPFAFCVVLIGPLIDN